MTTNDIFLMRNKQQKITIKLYSNKKATCKSCQKNNKDEQNINKNRKPKGKY